MSLLETLSDRPFVPLRGPLAHYEDAYSTLPDEPDFGVTSETRMLRLPAVALATLRVLAAPVAAMHPQQRGIVTEASLLLAHWGWTGGSRSAWEIASALQSRYWPHGWDSGYRRGGDPIRRIPRKGLDLLRAVDELGCEGVEVWVCVPRADDPLTFKTVRLREALSEFAPERSMPHAAP